MLEKIIDQYPDEEFLIADGFNEAIIGVEESSMRLVYSVQKVIKILMRDMNYEDAMEHFGYNVEGAYVGDRTPIWCNVI